MDATDHLFDAAERDELPQDPGCIRAFRFDRCKDWASLLGLYIGIVRYIPHYLGRCFKEQVRAAVEQGRLLTCIDEIYESFHKETGYEGSGYWRWYLQHRAELARTVTNSGPVGPHSRVRLTGLVACPELNGAEGWVRADPPQPQTGRLAVKLKSPRAAAARHPSGVWVKPSNLQQLQAPTAVWIVGPRVYPAWALDSGPGLFCKGFDFQPPSPADALAGPELLCGMPAKLGIPLVLTQSHPNMRCEFEAMAPLDHDAQSGKKRDEGRATRLLIEPESGFAPLFVQVRGVGPALVSRSDDADFTVEHLEELDRYLVHLLEEWSEFTKVTQAQALTRAAFIQFTAANQAS